MKPKQKKSKKRSWTGWAIIDEIRKMPIEIWYYRKWAKESFRDYIDVRYKFKKVRVTEV